MKNEPGQVRPIVFALVVMFLGLAAGALWLFGPGKEKAPEHDGAETGALSENTRSVLRQLTSPVEIRFYAILDPASVPGPEQAFAGRVDELLSEFEQAGGGNIRVTRHDERSTANMQAATADGIHPFNLDKGDACFLGLAVVQQEEMESLPRLSAEWEPALELDLTRAIMRVSRTKPATRPLAYMSQSDSTAIEEVKRILPNLASISVEEGSRLLRETALQQFKATAEETEVEVRKAQDRIREAQRGGSEAEQQEAIKQLLQIQAAQSQRLQEIAQRVEVQIAALEELKGVTRPPAGPRRTPSRDLPEGELNR